MNIDFEKMKNLLEEFKKLNIDTKPDEPSFMEISGYPYYENVCSNILQFFFKTDEVHGMKDLLIRALFKAAGKEYLYELSVNDVLREQTTLNNNRIDILIETDEFLIGIEVKIFAQLYNDLKDYSDFLNSIANGREVIRILLTLQDIPSNQDFISVTFNTFFQNINDLIGQYWEKANPKYLIYLKDFIQTITRLRSSREMNKELIDFFKENMKDAEMFFKCISDLRKELRRQVQVMGEEIKLNFDSVRCKQWFYRTPYELFDTLVHDVEVGDAIIAIDTIINPMGWRINMFLRKCGSNQLKNINELANWLDKKEVHKDSLIYVDEEGEVRLYYPDKDYKDFQETSKNLKELIKKICS